MRLRPFLAVAVLLLLGAGCGRKAVPPTPPPVKPPMHCPDLCAAVCAGQPEPAMPQDCPMPMCACDPKPMAPTK